MQRAIDVQLHYVVDHPKGSGGNDKPVTGFSFVFGINNEIRKEYLGTSN